MVVDFNNLLASSVEASLKAGTEILKIYNTKFNIKYKKDKSPVTSADLKANKIIKEILSKYKIPILSEESKNEIYDIRKKWIYFWLIDPIDGTKEFIKRNGEFTVNIALIKDGNPIIGVVYAPAKGELYFGSPEKGAKKINVQNPKDNGSNILDLINNAKKIPFLKTNKYYKILTGRCEQNLQTKEYIKKIKSRISNIKTIKLGSSLKICKVAEGFAQIYPRFHQTKEWDTAAAHAILKYSGGNLLNLNNKELKYNKEDIRNPNFIAQLNNQKNVKSII